MSLMLVLFGYLAGSVSSAVIVCRALGLPDPREQGSGNPGATNVLRLGGKKAAAITLLGDVLKGVLPVLLAHALSGEPAIVAATAFAAFLGHVYPVFFAFRGGKGVATAFGALIAVSWPVALVVLAVWGLTASLFRYSSLSALSSAVVAPIAMVVLSPQPAHVAAVVAVAVMLVWRHRSNIGRLLAGTESKIRS